MIKYLKDLKRVYLILVFLFIFIFIISGFAAYYTPYSGRAFVEYTMYPVYSKLQGEVEEVYVEDGQYVSVGDPIFRIDNEKQRLTVEGLRSQYRNEENNLAALDYRILEGKREVLKAKQRLANAKANYDRYRALYIEDFVAKAEYDRYKLTYDNSREEVEIARLSVTALEKERGERSTKENEVMKAIRSNIEKAEKDMADSVVKAPYSGEIFIQQLHRGQAVAGNKSYGYISTDEDIHINVDYMEKSLFSIKNGQMVIITFDAIPGRTFYGRVERTTAPQKSGYSSPENLVEIKESTRWIRTMGRSRVRVILSDKLPEGANIDSGSKAAVAIMNNDHRLFSRLTILWINIISRLNYIY